MNKMYEYLKNHAYISYNKKSNYEFELSEERAKCIANKYDSLTEKLQQENKQLKDNWNKLKEYLHNVDVVIDYSENYDGRFINYDELIDKMQEIEQGSDKQC